MPARLVEDERRVCARRNGSGDLGEVQVHRLDVAGRQDEAGRLAVLRADSPKDIGGGGPLIPQGHGTRAAFRPAPGDLRLLPDTRFIGEPNLSVSIREHLESLESLVIQWLRAESREQLDVDDGQSWAL